MRRIHDSDRALTVGSSFADSKELKAKVDATFSLMAEALEGRGGPRVKELPCGRTHSSDDTVLRRALELLFGCLREGCEISSHEWSTLPLRDMTIHRGAFRKSASAGAKEARGVR